MVTSTRSNENAPNNTDFGESFKEIFNLDNLIGSTWEELKTTFNQFTDNLLSFFSINRNSETASILNKPEVQAEFALWQKHQAKQSTALPSSISRNTKQLDMLEANRLLPQIQPDINNAINNGIAPWRHQTEPLVIARGSSNQKLIILEPKSGIMGNQFNINNYNVYEGPVSMGAKGFGSQRGSNQTPEGSHFKIIKRGARYRNNNDSKGILGASLLIDDSKPASDRNSTISRGILVHGTNNQNDLSKGKPKSAGCLRTEFSTLVYLMAKVKKGNVHLVINSNNLS